MPPCSGKPPAGHNDDTAEVDASAARAGIASQPASTHEKPGSSCDEPGFCQTEPGKAQPSRATGHADAAGRACNTAGAGRERPRRGGVRKDCQRHTGDCGFHMNLTITIECAKSRHTDRSIGGRQIILWPEETCTDSWAGNVVTATRRVTPALFPGTAGKAAAQKEQVPGDALVKQAAYPSSQQSPAEAHALPVVCTSRTSISNSLAITRGVGWRTAALLLSSGPARLALLDRRHQLFPSNGAFHRMACTARRPACPATANRHPRRRLPVFLAIPRGAHSECRTLCFSMRSRQVIRHSFQQ